MTRKSALGKPLVERVYAGPVLRRDREVQCVAGAQPEHVLIYEFRSGPEMGPGHRQFGEALRD